ncbi:hypothetical protein [Actinosynnema sp. NPDC020468]|uniref:hypothetical protein n=1 Tax=Actinosynnema sp. NPDC020468 TaxID=3154488 RepID=UPI0033E05E42
MVAHDELCALRALVRAEAVLARRAELVRLLDDGGAGALPRVAVVGGVGAGKSTLVNSLVGRPTVSPVGSVCPVEFGHARVDGARAVLAGAADRVVALGEVERYALGTVVEPVVGVRVRVGAPLLRSVVLVDTPGIGCVDAVRFDAVVFVRDADRAWSRGDSALLAAVVARTPACVVAVTKCDLVPHRAQVVLETAERVEAVLRGVPVHPVTAPFADRAGELADSPFAARLHELSGLGALARALVARAPVGAALVRAAARARAVGWAARELAGRRGVVDPARVEVFRSRVEDVRALYQSEAVRGPAAALPTLAPRAMAELVAAGVAVLTHLESVVGPSAAVGPFTGTGFAASVAVHGAGAGWWAHRGRRNRSGLTAWVDRAARAAESAVHRELATRLAAGPPSTTSPRAAELVALAARADRLAEAFTGGA